jgi:hypothetical protein
MAITLATFLIRFPEFSVQSEDVIEAILAQADRETDEVVWGDLHDDATYWLAAHMMAVRIREIGMFTGSTPAKQYINGTPGANVNMPFHLAGYSQTMYGQEFMRLENTRLSATIGFVV